MGWTDALEEDVLDEVFGGTAYAAVATWYIAASTTTPTDAGANFTEPAGNGYARVAVTNNTTNFPAASGGGVKANGTAITFPAATGSWGTITHIGGFTASTGGTVVWWGALSASKAIDNGDTFSIPIGDLDLTLD
jgi:hypothetical protein